MKMADYIALRLAQLATAAVLFLLAGVLFVIGCFPGLYR